MRTALFASGYLVGEDAMGNNRIARTKRYLEYYLKLQEELGFDHIWFADNHSDYADLEQVGGKVWPEEPIFADTAELINHYRFNEPLFRVPNTFIYPFAWRDIWFLRRLIEAGYDRILGIDTDTYVLTKKAAAHLKAIATGWEVMWCKKYKFPATECYVLCRDAFPTYLEFTKENYACHIGKLFETTLPFTKINTDLICNRYGEFNPPVEQAPWMDIYSQSSLKTEFNFEGAT